MFDYTPVTYQDEVPTCDLPGYASPNLAKIPWVARKADDKPVPMPCRNCADTVIFNRERGQWIHPETGAARCSAEISAVTTNA